MNEFMQDFAAANDELDDAKKQLSDANARARKCRQAVKDAQARVDKLRGYAKGFGVDLDGDGDDNDDSTESSVQSRADDNGDIVTDGYPHQFDE
ncbi:hypothetical protein ACEN2A_07805 [Corynebacterium auriscanis]|uniref:hypothetical protein n=1 Tax=Corynebacterium auriscanis TaxID=99807 RepID=UPI003CE7DB6C